VESQGFSSWERISAFAWGMAKTIGQHLKLGVILDRDFTCPEELDEIRGRLHDHLGFVRIHERKEIENYLLIPTVLTRSTCDAISDRSRRTGESIVPPDNLEGLLDELTQPLRNRLQAQYVAKRTEHLRRSKLDMATVAQETLDRFELEWNSLETRMCVVPGKEVLSKLREAVRNRYSVSLTTHRIVSTFRPKEVPPDLVELLTALDRFTAPDVIDTEEA
jgi:hypothetical protein